MVTRAACTPLCPAGHLPLKGGDYVRQGLIPVSAYSGHRASRDESRQRDNLLMLSPLEGEMSRSDRGGCLPHEVEHASF